ncbi:MAG: TIGR02449 family protein [Lautropia sp.]|nr:TIGR02449 family protein [Lautropia sp.]
MDQLGESIDRVLQVVRRLADENASLRDELAASRSVNEQLQQRIAEARARVESALARLPLPAQGSQ